MNLTLATWLTLPLLAILAIVWWSQYASYHGASDAPQSKIRWTPDDGLYVRIQHGEGISKPLKTTRVHVVETPFTKVFIPKGFELDGASIPAWLKPLVLLLDPWERYELPAAIHDLLYHARLASRFQADAFFRELMQDAGVPWVPRILLYSAVRLCGGKAWQASGKVDSVAAYQAEQQFAAYQVSDIDAPEGLA